MKQYKIVILDDVEISDNQENSEKEKLEMENSLKEYNKDKIGYSEYEYNTDDNIDKVLEVCMEDWANGEYKEDYTPVAAYCDGKFIGFFLIYQEVNVSNLNIEL